MGKRSHRSLGVGPPGGGSVSSRAAAGMGLQQQRRPPHPQAAPPRRRCGYRIAVAARLASRTRSSLPWSSPWQPCNGAGSRRLRTTDPGCSCGVRSGPLCRHVACRSRIVVTDLAHRARTRSCFSCRASACLPAYAAEHYPSRSPLQIGRVYVFRKLCDARQSRTSRDGARGSWGMDRGALCCIAIGYKVVRTRHRSIQTIQASGCCCRCVTRNTG